jgi:hypothetical protein
MTREVGRPRTRQTPGTLVRGTGHGRTPIAHGSADIGQPGAGRWGESNARKKAANRKRKQALQKAAARRKARDAKKPGDPPRPHKTWTAFHTRTRQATARRRSAGARPLRARRQRKPRSSTIARASGPMVGTHPPSAEERVTVLTVLTVPGERPRHEQAAGESRPSGRLSSAPIR